MSDTGKKNNFPLAVFMVLLMLSLHPSNYGRVSSAVLGLLVAVWWVRKSRGALKKAAICITIPVISFLSFSHLSIVVNDFMESNSINDLLGDTKYYFVEVASQTWDFLDRLLNSGTSANAFTGLKMQYVIPGIGMILLLGLVFLWALTKLGSSQPDSA
ncbi:MAG: hypothetical protein DRO99_04350 [Candidatus Aenigmatarchaeota archaeon]|nr:MAG: hypothetical protein DRO99_04350 [Candidatus Aenigmarchaeota archaeon]